MVAAACFDATYRRLLTGTQAGDCLDVWNFSNGAHLGTLSKSHVSNIAGCAWDAAVTTFLRKQSCVLRSGSSSKTSIRDLHVFAVPVTTVPRRLPAMT